MNIKSCIAAAALALLPMLSHAGIVYNWATTNTATPRQITFAIEFEESTVRSGGFSLHLTEDDLIAWSPRPELGLISFSLGLPNGDGIGHFDRQNAFGLPLGSLDMELGFDIGGELNGYIRSTDFQTAFSMVSTGIVFEMIELRSDGLPTQGCGLGEPVTCSGITGVIRQAEVPEPGTLALIGIGVFAASRKRGAQSTS